MTEYPKLPPETSVNGYDDPLLQPGNGFAVLIGITGDMPKLDTHLAKHGLQRAIPITQQGDVVTDAPFLIIAEPGSTTPAARTVNDVISKIQNDEIPHEAYGRMMARIVRSAYETPELPAE